LDFEEAFGATVLSLSQQDKALPGPLLREQREKKRQPRGAPSDRFDANHELLSHDRSQALLKNGALPLSLYPEQASKEPSLDNEVALSELDFGVPEIKLCISILNN
jgi:hypothetical protein